MPCGTGQRISRRAERVCSRPRHPDEHFVELISGTRGDTLDRQAPDALASFVAHVADGLHAVLVAGSRALRDLFKTCLCLPIFAEKPINRADARYRSLWIGDALSILASASLHVSSLSESLSSEGSRSLAQSSSPMFHAPRRAPMSAGFGILPACTI